MQGEAKTSFAKKASMKLLRDIAVPSCIMKQFVSIEWAQVSDSLACFIRFVLVMTMTVKLSRSNMYLGNHPKQRGEPRNQPGNWQEGDEVHKRPQRQASRSVLLCFLTFIQVRISGGGGGSKRANEERGPLCAIHSLPLSPQCTNFNYLVLPEAGTWIPSSCNWCSKLKVPYFDGLYKLLFTLHLVG